MRSTARAVALDSNAVRALTQTDPKLLAAVAGRELCLQCVVLSESLRGWQDLVDRHNRQKNEARLADALARLCEFHEFARDLEVLRYSTEARRTYATLRTS